MLLTRYLRNTPNIFSSFLKRSGSKLLARALVTMTLGLLIPFFISTAQGSDLEKLAKDDWIKISSENFEIVTDLAADDAQYLIKDLEAFRHFTVNLLRLDVLAGLPPLRILAIDDNKNFKRLGLPENWAGVFGLGIYGYAAIASVHDYKSNMNKPSFARQVLLHEYVHHLMRFTTTSRKYPMWYDEGNADYLGSFRYDGQNVYLGDFRAIEFRAWALFGKMGHLSFDSKKLLNTTSLNLSKNNSRKDSEEASVFYGAAFFLIHYIRTEPELQTALDDYLYDIYLGFPQDLAFKHAFNMTYDELDKRVLKYLRNDRKIKMRVYSVNGEGREFPDAKFSSVKLSKGDFYKELAFIAPLFRAFEKELKSELFSSAIALNPSNLPLQAWTQIFNPEAYTYEQRKALDAEIPDHPIVLTRQADRLRIFSQDLYLLGAPNWLDVAKEARSYYRRAIKADPNYTSAYYGLAQVYYDLPDSEPLREGFACWDQTSLFTRYDSAFMGMADIAMRMKSNEQTILALRNVMSFGEESSQREYSYILDNLELQFDLSVNKTTPTAKGLSYSEGSEYVGPLKDGKPHGKGKITRPNGSYYQGDFELGVMQGKGLLHNYLGVEYQGDFSEGIMRGHGELRFPKAHRYTYYTGAIEYGEPHGQGRAVTSKGEYQGEFSWAQHNGQGIFTSAIGAHKISGLWRMGRFEWPSENGEIFVGGINDEGQRQGFGLCRQDSTYENYQYCEYKDGVKVVKTASAN